MKITLEQDNKDPIVIETDTYLVLTDQQVIKSGLYFVLLGLLEQEKILIQKELTK